jgi:glucosylceramidase
MKLHTTIWQQNAPVFQTAELIFLPDEQTENNLINLYPEMRFQTLLGFGGAFTEAAGSVLNKMPAEVRETVLQGYFGRDGLGYTLGRTHIDSCDFSLGNYSTVTDPDDTAFATMRLSREETYILPHIRRAQELAGRDIRILLAPWSPPAFMKTNGQRNCGGSLRPECYFAWAKYMVKYLGLLVESGVHPLSVSTQNEPKAAQPWDSCVYTAEEEGAFVRDYLAPALQAAGLNVGITLWDHNKERMFDRSQAILADPRTDATVTGIAFHWYSGDHFEAIELTHLAHPDKLLLFTEGCVEYSRFAADQLANAQMYAHDILGNLNAGAHAFVDWNLVLNAQGGPNHTGNYCDAPVLYDVENSKVETKLSYHYIGHFSRYLQPGAVRIGKTVYTAELEACAFQNPDDSLVCVVLNQSEKELPFTLRLHGKTCCLSAPANSIQTALIHAVELA